LNTTAASTILALAVAFALSIPYFFLEMRRGKAHGHTWFTRWKPLGHSDIGPDIGGMRQIRPGHDSTSLTENAQSR
jgi:hypothetical protein